MTDPAQGHLWLLIGLIAVVTVAIKAFGPVVLGGRPLSPAAMKVLVLLPAVVLAALVATSTLADGTTLQVDARTVGVAVGGVLLWRGRPMLVAVLVAVAVTAALRAVG